MTEPPDPWDPPRPDQPEGHPGQYGAPPPYQGGPPSGNAYEQWQGFNPPPGWRPPRKQPLSKGEFALGLISCVLLNVVLFTALLPAIFGQATALVALGVNVAAIVIPAVKGHKGFAVGFANGYAVMLVLLIGACFLWFPRMG